MTITEYNAYFRRFAAADPALLHTDEKPAFFKGDAKEGAQFLSSGLDRLTLMVAPAPKRPRMSPGENHVWQKQFSILIVGPAGPDNYDQQEAVREQAEAASDRLFARMMNDRVTELYGFDGSTYSADPVGPVVDQHYGYMLTFEIMDPVLLG